MKTSWKTTVFGAVTALGVYLATIPDPAWISTIGKGLMVMGPLLHGFFGRDNNVTSEDAGAKTK